MEAERLPLEDVLNLQGRVQGERGGDPFMTICQVEGVSGQGWWLSPGLILGGGASCFLRVEQPRVDEDYSARGDTTI